MPSTKNSPNKIIFNFFIIKKIRFSIIEVFLLCSYNVYNRKSHINNNIKSYKNVRMIMKAEIANDF